MLRVGLCYHFQCLTHTPSEYDRSRNSVLLGSSSQIAFRSPGLLCALYSPPLSFVLFTRTPLPRLVCAKSSWSFVFVRLLTCARTGSVANRANLEAHVSTPQYRRAPVLRHPLTRMTRTLCAPSTHVPRSRVVFAGEEDNPAHLQAADPT